MKRTRIDVAAAACAVAFVAVLLLAGYWDRSIRILHVFESMPYLLAAVLLWRRRRLGHAIGFVSGAFWLWCGAFLTTFVRNGFERLEMLVRTGAVDRPDILIAVPAAAAASGLALFSVVGYARLANSSWRDFLPLMAAFVAVPAFFLAIFAAFAPQYLGMFRGLLGR